MNTRPRVDTIRVIYKGSTAWRADAEKRVCVFHLPKDKVEGFFKNHFNIYSYISQLAERFEYEQFILEGGEETLDQILDNPNHIHFAFLDRPVKKQNLIYVVPAFLRGFWYFDPKGVHNHSSIKSKKFNGDTIDIEVAKTFADGLNKRFVSKNYSKWPQAEIGSEPLEKNAITIFLQAHKVHAHETRFFGIDEMIEAVIENKKDRPVYIKPHPKDKMREVENLMRYHRPDEGISLSAASIHDLLAHSDWMVTHASSVALSAQMHKTPAILCGDADFHHNMITIQDAGAMSGAFEEVQRRHFEYERYLYWYFRQNCVRGKNQDAIRMWQSLASAGMEFGHQALEYELSISPSNDHPKDSA